MARSINDDAGRPRCNQPDVARGIDCEQVQPEDSPALRSVLLVGRWTIPANALVSGIRRFSTFKEPGVALGPIVFGWRQLGQAVFDGQ